MEELASEPILKLAGQRRTKWGGQILPREKKKGGAHASKARKFLENSRTFNYCDAIEKWHLRRNSQEMRLKKPSVSCRA